MERILELLALEKPENFRTALNLLTPSVLDTSPDQLKHRLKVRISALLKSSGRTRAYGAVLARKALVDWSVMKSHGSSWAVILLHALDLPDAVCWKPATKTLAYLFSRVYGKTDLAREIGGSKIGDFMKRLVSTLSTTQCYSAAVEMLRLYPTQCRPYINKLEPIVRNRSTLALASLCISEKQSVEVWTSRITECLNKLSEHGASLSELELEYQLNAVSSYISVAPIIQAKVPAQLLSNVLSQLLALLKPAAVISACKFICATFDALRTMYIQQFDNLAYRLSDCIDMGIQEALCAIEVIYRLVKSAGWVSENYSRLFTRVIKKVLKIWDEQNIAIGAQGLADYVQAQSAFLTPMLSPENRKLLIDFLTIVILYVPGIPQSSRGKVDKVILMHGSAENVILSTLYPAKYSILPLAIHKLPQLSGMEALVHPRFPPLKISKRLLDDEFLDDEHEIIERESNEPTEGVVKNSPGLPESQTDQKESSINNLEESISDSNGSNPFPLPIIPESTKPTYSESSAAPPPEKRVKTEHLIMQDSSNLINSVEGLPTQEDEADDNDDGEELVIPTLSMDSD